MLNATLDLHLSKFSSQVAQDMKTNLYVDNLISGCNSEKEAIDYYKKARSILCEAKFNLRSWSSNSFQLRAVTSKDQTNDPNECVNLLGLRWHTLNDTLSFAPRKFQSLSSSQLITKREILRDSAQIYDPLGFLTPVTVKAKMLVQTLWKLKMDWDEPLKQELADKWSTIATDIQDAITISHPRPCCNPDTQATATQLHVFADASPHAYGAVAYLRQDGQ